MRFDSFTVPGPDDTAIQDTPSFRMHPVRKGPFMRARTIATFSLGLLLVGCQGTYRQASPIAAQPANLVCADYGVATGTTTFADCVAYQESRNPGPSVPPYRMDQYNNLVDAEGYRVDGTGRRMRVQSPYSSPMGEASSSQTVLRDEYGNRYDSRGRRIN
jgi:hypothetical protein